MKREAERHESLRATFDSLARELIAIRLSQDASEPETLRRERRTLQTLVATVVVSAVAVLASIGGVPPGPKARYERSRRPNRDLRGILRRKSSGEEGMPPWTITNVAKVCGDEV